MGVSFELKPLRRDRRLMHDPSITRLPPAYPGMRIGLFGGSFNPPHEGHRLVALQALRRLGLDAVWLLVSPGNPLKPAKGMAAPSSKLRWSGKG